MEVWRGKSVSGNKRKTKSPKKGLSLRKLGRNYSGFWLLVNTNHYNLCFCCVSPNMHHNHKILAGRKEGLEWEWRQTLPVVFISSDSHYQRWPQCFNKELCWTVSGACDLQRRPNIIPHFPGFCCVLPDLIILFPEITTETASGSHSCGKEVLCGR